eukprot:4115692-Prymnesium_polylepis.1
MVASEPAGSARSFGSLADAPCPSLLGADFGAATRRRAAGRCPMANVTATCATAATGRLLQACVRAPDARPRFIAPARRCSASKGLAESGQWDPCDGHPPTCQRLPAAVDSKPWQGSHHLVPRRQGAPVGQRLRR